MKQYLIQYTDPTSFEVSIIYHTEMNTLSLNVYDTINKTVPISVILEQVGHRDINEYLNRVREGTHWRDLTSFFFSAIWQIENKKHINIVYAQVNEAYYEDHFIPLYNGSFKNIQFFLLCEAIIIAAIEHKFRN